MPYPRAHWYVLAVIAVIVAGFWPSYFRIWDDVPWQFHAHGVAASIWVMMVFAQSWTAHHKQLPLHRAVGKSSLFLFPFLIGGLATLSLPGIPWQSSGVPAFASVIIVTLWIRVGFTMIIYLAGLQAVPVELQEAAQVEGAGGWQRFRHITFPLLGPSTFFLLVMSVIYSFQVFDIVFVLTNGGPGSSTEVLGTYAYKTAFGAARDQGYGAAIGVVIFFFTLIFTVIQWRTNRTRDEVA